MLKKPNKNVSEGFTERCTRCGRSSNKEIKATKT